MRLPNSLDPGEWQTLAEVYLHYHKRRFPGADVVTRVQARVAEMIFLNPVVHELERIKAPTILMIGQLDRTAIGANRAPADVAKRLGDYPELGRAAARRIPNARLIEFSDLGHAPQIQAPDEFHRALLQALGN